MGEKQLNTGVNDEDVRHLVAFLKALAGELPAIKEPKNPELRGEPFNEGR